MLGERVRRVVIRKRFAWETRVGCSGVRIVDGEGTKRHNSPVRRDDVFVELGKADPQKRGRKCFC